MKRALILILMFGACAIEFGGEEDQTGETRQSLGVGEASHWCNDQDPLNCRRDTADSSCRVSSQWGVDQVQCRDDDYGDRCACTPTNTLNGPMYCDFDFPETPCTCRCNPPDPDDQKRQYGWPAALHGSPPAGYGFIGMPMYDRTVGTDTRNECFQRFGSTMPKPWTIGVNFWCARINTAGNACLQQAARCTADLRGYTLERREPGCGDPGFRC